jgi:hypothetical protein
VVFLEILQADLEMELTSASDDVLARLRRRGNNAGIRLRQALETFDQLREILSVLDLDGTLHDGGHGELHDLEVVGSVAGGQGTALEKELVDTDKADDVSGRHVINRLDLAAHHEHRALNSLDEQVLLLSGCVVRSLDADLETGTDGTGEDTAEGIETTLIGGRHHLGDVKHERALGVTVTDTDGSLIVRRALVQRLDTVSLGGDGRRKVENHHFQKTVSSGQESAHDNLEKLLALLFTVLNRELEFELLEESSGLILLEVHDGREDFEDGVQDELIEGTLELLALIVAVLGPLLGLRVEVVVSLLRVSDC